MESGGGTHPSGDQCTVETNQGSLPSVSAQDSTSPTPLNRTLQGSPSDAKDEFPCGAPLLDKNGDRDSEGTQGQLSKVGSERSAQRSSKSSAFPSSLTWDSDSEKETQDEEELQHFCNPHGLAAHSPGSPTSGCEPDRILQEDCQTPEQSKKTLPEKDLLIPMQDQTVTAQAEGPKRVLSTEPKLQDAEAGNVSREKETFLPKAKPKRGCYKGEAKDDKEKDRDVGQEKDVYTFPGDSDPESPPPAPWAHCTFVERRRRKRALLRPFSGLGSWQRTMPGSSRKSRVPALRPKESRTVVSDSGIFDFKEEEEEDEEEEDAEEEDMEEEDEADGKEQMKESETPQEPNQEIFTCVECSIYFKKKCHLRDHMREHSQREGRGGKATGSRRGKAARFECKECGQLLEDKLALTNHQRQHQESRCKILEEISKLNEGGKKAGERSSHCRVTETKGKKPTPICHQFVCLKCNFSTDIPQELADHAKAHAPRKRAGMLRCSPRFQPKLSTPEKIQSPGTRPSGLATTLSCDQHSMPESGGSGVCEHLCPAHSSQISTTEVGRQNKADPHAEPDLDPAVPPQILSDPLEKHTVPKQTPPQAGLSQEVVGTPIAADAAMEDCSHEVKLAETQSENPGPAPPKREVAFKSIGNRRSARGSKGSIRPVHSFAREDNASDPGVQEQGQVEIKDQPLKKTQTVPEASAGSSGDSSKDPVEVPAAAKQLKCSFSASLQGATDGQQVQLKHMVPLVLIEPLFPDSQTPLSYPGFGERSKTLDEPSTQQHPIAPSSPKQRYLKQEPENEETTDSIGKTTCVKVKNEKEDDEDGSDAEDDVRRFLNESLSDDEDEDEGLIKNMERKCPYCPERFHNGIGLANHVRGHLNRVGVSYNVRHFISPEEVNAIEKKFSYQKKKKKVANFDPDTFSVMRCEFCSAGFDTRAGLSSHARAHLRDFGITNWEVTVSPIHILRELFSSRPDLVLPTAPPRTPTPGEEIDPDLNSEADKPGSTGHKRKEANDVPKQSSPLPWKTRSVGDREGEGQQHQKEDKDEDEEDKMPVLDAASPAEMRLSPLESENGSPREDADSKGVLKCKVCGALFETRRGLSSHARSHLRQLGVGMSESSGAPIDLLYQITKERTLAHSPPPQPKRPSRDTSSPSFPQQQEQERFEEEEGEEEEDVKPPVLASAVQQPPSPSIPSRDNSMPPSPFVRSRSPSPVLRKAPISSLLPVSSPLRSLDARGGMGKTLPAPVLPPSKPYWAPQETDAPLNLTMEPDPNKDIVCQLCGAWFETRKGLSSHARAHLRHFGVEYSESKGSPIDLLNRLILTDDFKRRVASLSPSAGIEDLRSLVSFSSSSSPPSSSASSSKRPLLASSPASPSLFKASSVGGGSPKTTSSLFGPPSKKPRASPQQVFRLSGGELTPYSQEPLKDVGCEFCGEYFENRKGLSSHARSHLRQMGITEWSVNGSPIDTLREIITRRGLPCALPLRPLKSPPSSPGPGPPRVPVSSPPRSSTPSASPPGGILRRLPFPFTHPPGQHQPTARRMEASASTSRASASPSTPSLAAPLKPKPEPVQLEVTHPGTAVEGGEGGAGAFATEHLAPSWVSPDSLHPLSMGLTHDSEPTRDIRCEFCGEYFENRKGLSSHARSHLRQMGITEWSVNGSPIDTLREIMRKQQGGSPSSRTLLPSTSPSAGVKKEPCLGGSPTWDGLGQQPSRFSRKPPVNLLHSVPRLHKHGMGMSGVSTLPAGKFFTVVSPQGKRPSGEDGRPTERVGNQGPQPKAFSPGPQDFSFKGKASPDKHGVGHLDASCELCGFYFENRKALASHARAHLRQFGVTEWSVNGSPIETLSAWMRNRPHKVAEMHRGYMQGGRSGTKKRGFSSLSPSSDSGPTSPVSQKPSSALWSSLSQSRNRASEVAGGQWGSSRSNEVRAGNRTSQHGHTAQVTSSALPHAQVARSELNVRLPRGFERRPLKHPSHPDAGEGDTGPPKPPRTSTVPALVPKPPSTPLVKVVGKIYSLKCRFCEVEFHGPLSVQEDWIRHLQQHILNLNYTKPATPGPTSDPSAATKSMPENPTSSAPVSFTTSTPSSITTATLTLTPNPTPTATALPTPVQTPTPTPTPSSPATPTPTAMSSTLPPCTVAKPLPSPAT